MKDLEDGVVRMGLFNKIFKGKDKKAIIGKKVGI